MILQVGAALASWWLAFVIRFEGNPPDNIHIQFLVGLPVVAAARLFTYYVFGLHRRIWRYTGTIDLLTLAYSAALGSVVTATVVLFLIHGQDSSRSVYIIDFLINLSLIAGMRFLVRILKERQPARLKRGRRILVVGAGDAGEMIVREMLQTPEKGYFPVAFADDDPAKLGQRIHGVPVLGAIPEIPRAQLQSVAAGILPGCDAMAYRMVASINRESPAIRGRGC